MEFEVFAQQTAFAISYQRIRIPGIRLFILIFCWALLVLPAIQAAELTDQAATGLQLPEVGDSRLRLLTPQLLELTLITTRPATGPGDGRWNFVDASQTLQLPPPAAFRVKAGEQTFNVSEVGFKRRVVYAPLQPRDLRIGNWLYLRLDAPLPAGAAVRVTNPDGTFWGQDTVFQTVADPLRWSPAIHVNQTGYLPRFPKVATVGYFLGSLGEMDLPAAQEFQVITADTGTVVLRGQLVSRPDG